MERRRALSEIDENVSPSLNFQAQSSEEQAIDELSQRMLSWSRLWFGSSAGCRNRPMNITWCESGFSPGWSVASVATLAPF